MLPMESKQYTLVQSGAVGIQKGDAVLTWFQYWCSNS